MRWIVFSPLGKLAPGNSEIDTVFKNMWVEVENIEPNRVVSHKMVPLPVFFPSLFVIPPPLSFLGLGIHNYSDQSGLYSELGRTATLFDVSDGEGSQRIHYRERLLDRTS